MLSANQKITARQMQMLLILESFGAGAVVLPRRAAEYASVDGWLAVLGLLLPALLIGWLLTAAARQYPGMSFIKGMSRAFPRPLARIIFAVWLAKLLLCAGLETRLFLFIVQDFLLHDTPPFIIGALMTAIAAYASAKGIETRARVAEVLFFITMVPFILFFVLAVFDADFSNLQPMFSTPPAQWVTGVFRLGYLFTGMECLLLALPYLKHPGKARPSIFPAIITVGLLFTFTTAVTTAKFGAEETADRAWPLIQMMDMVRLPGSFIERLDTLAMSFFITTLFMSVGMALFYSAVLCEGIIHIAVPVENGPDRAENRKRFTAFSAGVLNCKNAFLAIGPPVLKRNGAKPNSPAFSGRCVWLCALAVFMVSQLPLSAETVHQWMGKLLLPFNLIFLLILPLIILTPRRPAPASRPIYLLLAIVLVLYTTAGCYDRVEIENRAFAIAMAFDKAEGPACYEISLALPTLSKDNPEAIRQFTANGRTWQEALKKLDAKAGGKIYLGQVKTILLGDALIRDRHLFSTAIQVLQANKDINQRVLVLAAPTKAGEVLAAHPPDETAPAFFFPEFYRYADKAMGVTFPLELTRLLSELSPTGSAVLPLVEVYENAPRISGALAVKDMNMAGCLSADETRGYLWRFSNDAIGAVITAEIDGAPAPFLVKKHRVAISFAEADDRLYCAITVNLTGQVTEYLFKDELLSNTFAMENLRHCYEKTVADEIQTTADKMRMEWVLDGFRLMDELRKEDTRLYKKYASNPARALMEMEIVPVVKVEVE